MIIKKCKHIFVYKLRHQETCKVIVCQNKSSHNDASSVHPAIATHITVYKLLVSVYKCLHHNTK